MRNGFPNALACVVLVAASPAFAQQDGGASLSPTWPQFRGPQASGVPRTETPLPDAFDVEEDTRWKASIPGLAHSSPVVAGDRVFVTTAVPASGTSSLKIGLYGAGDSAEDLEQHDFQVWCLDLHTGAVRWVRTAARGVPAFARHTKATHADPSPATDGRHVVALFPTQGLFCMTVDGDRVWRRDLGNLDVGPHNSMDLQWGYASSPVIADGRVVVQADVKKDPFLATFDVETSREIWRVARQDVPTWATPTVAGDQILVNGCKQMGAYAFDDGRLIWSLSGGGGIPIPAPLVFGDLVLLTNNHRPLVAGHPVRAVFAVRRSAKGTLPVSMPDDPGEQVAWTRDRVGNYIQTPIIYRGVFYLCKGNGIVAVVDPRDGSDLGRFRLGEGGVGFSASAVAGDGKIYFTSEEGTVFTVRVPEDSGELKQAFENASRSELGDICMATPAVVERGLVFRTKSGVVLVEAGEGR